MKTAVTMIGVCSLLTALVVLVAEVFSGTFRDKELPMSIGIFVGCTSLLAFAVFLAALLLTKAWSKPNLACAILWLSVAGCILWIEMSENHTTPTASQEASETRRTP
jgi:cell shape-determining protein MreD